MCVRPNRVTHSLDKVSPVATHMYALMLDLGELSFDLVRSHFHELRGEKISTTVKTFRSG